LRFCEAGGEKPFLVAEGNKEMDVRMLSLDSQYGGVIHVVVVVMADYYCVYDGYIFYLAGDFGVAFGT
jgi:hypothetical protein